jgi:uroporphyrinogen-III decarboxylase
LIRGTPVDTKKEIMEILKAWEGQPRLILGTGDQVGKETPEDNIYVMIETAKKFGKY